MPAREPTRFSSAHFALPANVEYLVLQGTADLQGFGNGVANTITGNLGSARRRERRCHERRRRNDTYFVDNAGDAVMESAGQGNDACSPP